MWKAVQAKLPPKKTPDNAFEEPQAFPLLDSGLLHAIPPEAAPRQAFQDHPLQRAILIVRNLRPAISEEVLLSKAPGVNAPSCLECRASFLLQASHWRL